mmetsp:Transcript_16207/g.47267  ORF Transcript_16207/g.47267 Transcript_16207/m.47267 type:complete len:81 (+) Transcript_16207:313-555(+)
MSLGAGTAVVAKADEEQYTHGRLGMTREKLKVIAQNFHVELSDAELDELVAHHGGGSVVAFVNGFLNETYKNRIDRTVEQ